VSIVTTKFTGGSHQSMIDMPTNSTNHIYEIAKKLFDELWGTEKEPLRKFGVRVSKLQSGGYFQESLLQEYDFEKESIIDGCVDTLRLRYGSNIIHRASFLNSGLKPVNGGIGEDGYPVMTCNL
jgi:DNA polymerase-4